jgi:hypothetical protein
VHGQDITWPSKHMGWRNLAVQTHGVADIEEQ